MGVALIVAMQRGDDDDIVVHVICCRFRDNGESRESSYKPSGECWEIDKDGLLPSLMCPT
jgi:hypothetical protein